MTSNNSKSTTPDHNLEYFVSVQASIAIISMPGEYSLFSLGVYKPLFDAAFPIVLGFFENEKELSTEPLIDYLVTVNDETRPAYFEIGFSSLCLIAGQLLEEYLMKHDDRRLEGLEIEFSAKERNETLEARSFELVDQGHGWKEVFVLVGGKEITGKPTHTAWKTHCFRWKEKQQA